MPWIVIIVLATLILLAFKVLQKKTPVSLPYRRAGPLFTPAERSFLGVLDQVLGAEHRAFGKVRVADLVTVATGLEVLLSLGDGQTAQLAPPAGDPGLALPTSSLSASGPTLVLLVSPADAERLAYAQAFAELTVAIAGAA